MTTNYDRHSISAFKELLTPISANAPAGANLYYEPIYDQIREARREDDQTLSQGVWQTTFKKADWAMVENLCRQALATQSKDLQIASWLVEAWITMDQLNGLTKGIDLLKELCDAYWDSIFPELQQDDNERRLHMLEWLDNAWKTRIVIIPVLENHLDSSPMTLADWMHANRLDTVSKRAPDRQKMLQQAERQNELTLERVQQILGMCPKDLLEQINLDAAKALQAYDQFKKLLDMLLKDDSRPAMNAVPDTLKELQRFMQAGLDRSGSATPPPTALTDEILQEDSFILSESEVSTDEIKALHTSAPQNRSTAYKMLDDIGNFLQGIEPHSPAPALLKRIATWENKTISEIFKDFGDTPEDWATLARFIGSSRSQKPDTL